MKNLFVGLVMAVASISVSAATLELSTTDAGVIVGVASSEVEVQATKFGLGEGSFSSDAQLIIAADGGYHFSTNTLETGESSNLWISLDNLGDAAAAYNIGAVVDGGNNFIKNLVLTAGTYLMSWGGTGAENSSFSSTVAVSATPIPAAVWLFGSMLMGFFGLRSRVAK